MQKVQNQTDQSWANFENPTEASLSSKVKMLMLKGFGGLPCELRGGMSFARMVSMKLQNFKNLMTLTFLIFLTAQVSAWQEAVPGQHFSYFHSATLVDRFV